MIVMALINIKQVKEDKAPANASYNFAVFTLILYSISSVMVAIFVSMKPKHLVKHSMTRRCGYIYLPYHFEKPTKGSLASIYPALNIARIFVLVITIMYGGHLLVVQMMVICLSTIFIMSWVGFVRPYRDPGTNSEQLYYEFTILLVTNFLLVSSISSLKFDAKPMLGWAIIFTIGSLLFYS